jgi:hypothetical protein
MMGKKVFKIFFFLEIIFEIFIISKTGIRT